MEILCSTTKKYKLFLNEMIGQGSQGKIMLIHEEDNPNRIYAAKQLKLKENNKKDIYQEIAIHQGLRH